METPGTAVGSIGSDKTMTYGDPFQRRYSQAGLVMLAQVASCGQTTTASSLRWRQAPKADAAVGVSDPRAAPLSQGNPDLFR